MATKLKANNNDQSQAEQQRVELAFTVRKIGGIWYPLKESFAQIRRPDFRAEGKDPRSNLLATWAIAAIDRAWGESSRPDNLDIDGSIAASHTEVISNFEKRFYGYLLYQLTEPSLRRIRDAASEADRNEIPPVYLKVTDEFCHADLRFSFGPATPWKVRKIYGPKSKSRKLEKLDSVRIVSHDDYEQQKQRLLRRSDAFRNKVAKAIELPLNEHAAALPQKTTDEKKFLAKWINAELRSLDLAISCPKTGRPSYLAVGESRHPGEGRFLIENHDENGRVVRPTSSEQLPELHLIPHARGRAGPTTTPRRR